MVKVLGVVLMVLIQTGNSQVAETRTTEECPRLRYVCKYASRVEDYKVTQRVGLYLQMQGADQMAAFLDMHPLPDDWQGAQLFVIADSASGRNYDGRDLVRRARRAMREKRNRVLGFMRYPGEITRW